MRVWTEEQKAKAAATRAETKRKKEEREAKKQSRLAANPDIDPTPDTPAEVLQPQNGRTPSVVKEVVGFDWHHAPLEQVMARLGDMKREYDRCTQIVLARQNISKPRWTCWTQLHKELVPKSVATLCRKTGEDGKWASRDDGHFKMVEDIRVPDPVFCCSALCHELYLKSKPMQALSRH
jgi:hypothetical protein